MTSHSVIPGESFELLANFRAGDESAAAAIFDRYVERLVALTRTRLSKKLRQRIDPEDVVQSAFRSFFLHARNGGYAFEHADDVWRLLAAITLNKLYGSVEWHGAQRRATAREERNSGELLEHATVEPTPAEAVALAEQLHLVSERLTPEQQLVLMELLRGIEVDGIAAMLRKSPRTVRRLLADTRDQFERFLASKNALDANTDRLIPNFDHRVTLRASDYILERLLGAGGMGKVYRARECATGRTFAIKALRKRHQRDRRAVERFLQEADILERLRHPNIVRVHGLGQFPGGGLFLVMEYVCATNLQEELRHGPLDPWQSLEIVHQIAAAIGHAHEHRIVHADLKPANILWCDDGRPIVTDFGFAHIVATRAIDRATGIGGTTGYMAPEVFHLHQPPTIAADIFGLGALLWSLVDGTVPGTATSLRCDSVAAELIEPICRKCLADCPEHRFCDTTELCAALADAIARA